MARTKRIYNVRGTGVGFYHPYRQVCMGHCRGCKQQFIEEALERKRELVRFFRSEVKNALGGRC